MVPRPQITTSRLVHTGLILVVAGVFVGERAQGQDSDHRFGQLQEQIDTQNRRIQQLEAELGHRSDSTTPQASADAHLLRHAAFNAQEIPQSEEEPPKSTDGLPGDGLLAGRVERLEQLLLQLEGIDGDFLESLATESKRVVNGRLHIDTWAFPDDSPGVNVIENGDPESDPQNRLLYRRLRFGVRGSVPPGNMSYRLEIEFSGQDGSQFRDAWLGWDDLAFFETVRLGNQKRPYGLDHLNSSNFNVFLERPFVVDGFNEDNRRFGLVSYGVSDDRAFNWRYGFYNLELIQDIASTVNDDFQMEFAWRLAHTWWYDETSSGRGYGHWGLSGTFAFPDGNAPNNGKQNNAALFRTFPEGRSSNRWLDTGRIDSAEAYQILGVESVINVGGFQFAAEFMNLWLQRDGMPGTDINLHGGYFYLSYFLTGEHIPWNRELGILGRVRPFENFFFVDTCRGRTGHGWGAWQLAVRLSYADFNDRDIFGGIGSNLTLAANWYWNSHARLQFNYIIGQVDDRRADLDTGGTAIISGDYRIVGVRFMIDF